MKKPIALVALVSLYGAGAVAVSAQQSTPQPHRGNAENALIGVALFDTGAKVISKYGSPDEIQALSIGGAGNTGGTGGGGASTGPGAAGAAGGGRRGGGGGGGVPQADVNAWVGDPFSDTIWQSKDGPPVMQGGEAAGSGGRSSAGGPPGGAPGGRDGGGVGGGTASGGQNQVTVYTRWIYKRNGSRHAFVFDKFNRVVQIESIGMSNKSVRTKRGITFGSTFGQVIKAYNAPDGYEINGDNIVAKFLVRDRVAFRLSKLKADGVHVVTGIVVAAGK